MIYIFGRYHGEEEYKSSIISLLGVSDWNKKNVTDISGMFTFYSSLAYLSDISKWNTENVNDMSYLFDYCESLKKTIPDISKWNIKSVKVNGKYVHFNIINIIITRYFKLEYNK